MSRLTREEQNQLCALQQLKIQSLELELRRKGDEIFLEWFQVLNLPRIFGGTVILLLLAAWLFK
jgi:hypothetical protein